MKTWKLIVLMLCCSMIGICGKYLYDYFAQSAKNKDAYSDIIDISLSDDIVVEGQEFAESKAATAGNGGQGNYSRSSSAPSDANGFMNIPDGIDDELPFS